jgi:hypothetical protein
LKAHVKSVLDKDNISEQTRDYLWSGVQNVINNSGLKNLNLLNLTKECNQLRSAIAYEYPQILTSSGSSGGVTKNPF